MADCAECEKFAESNSKEPFIPSNSTVNHINAWCTKCGQGWVQHNISAHLWFEVKSEEEMREWVRRIKKQWPLAKEACIGNLTSGG